LLVTAELLRGRRRRRRHLRRLLRGTLGCMLGLSLFLLRHAKPTRETPETVKARGFCLCLRRRL
jgi:hypothetical protein